MDDNLSEYWKSNDGDALLVDADQLSASLRILKKNKIINTTMAPVITCKSGQEVTLDMDGFHIEAEPRITADAGVLIMTKTHQGPYTKVVDTHAVLRDGQRLFVRANQEEGIYVVLAAELMP